MNLLCCPLFSFMFRFFYRLLLPLLPLACLSGQNSMLPGFWFPSDFCWWWCRGSSIYGLRFIPKWKMNWLLYRRFWLLSLLWSSWSEYFISGKFFNLCEEWMRSGANQRNGYWQRLSARKSKNGSVLRKSCTMGWDLCWVWSKCWSRGWMPIKKVKSTKR